MRLDEYMAANGLDDEAMAALVRREATPGIDEIKCDRSEISKYRRRQIRPSWPKIIRIKEVTGGQVPADSWVVLEAAE